MMLAWTERETWRKCEGCITRTGVGKNDREACGGGVGCEEDNVLRSSATFVR